MIDEDPRPISAVPDARTAPEPPRSDRGGAVGQRVAVIVNLSSGAGAAPVTEGRLRDLFGGAGTAVEVTLAGDEPQFQRALAQAIASKVDAIVAGGGDGTLSAVAESLAGHDIPLGILPLGTLNHFAKDLGISTDLEDAVRVVLAGHTVRVDVGEVNGQVFLNNSSLGLYPTILRLRGQHAARGLRKWVVAIWATAIEVGRFRRLVVRVDVNGERRLHHTPLLLVGNNRYRMAGLEAGTRDSLLEGQLAVYVVHAQSRWQLMRLAWKVLQGRSHDAGELDVLHVHKATIEARVPHLPVALDGEVLEMETPLEYRVRPAALRVFVPAAGAGHSPDRDP